jgi:WD40 repeat protein
MRRAAAPFGPSRRGNKSTVPKVEEKTPRRRVTRSRVRHPALMSAGAAGLVIAVIAAVLLAHSATGSSAGTPSSPTRVSLGSQRIDQLRPGQFRSAPLRAQPSPSLPSYPEAILTDPDSAGVESVAFSPDDSILAAGDYNGWTYLWRAGAHTIIGGGVHDANNEYVWCVAFSSDGKTFATADNHVDAVVRNVAGAQNPVATLPGQGSTSAFSLAYSPDDKILAVGDSDGNTYLWRIATEKIIATLPDPGSSGVRSVAFNPQGTILAVGDANYNTYLFNVATHQRIADLVAPNSKQVFGVAFSPDGNILAAADNNGDTYLWNVATHRLIATLPDTNGTGLRGVAFSPFGQIIAVADANYQTPILLWNVITHKQIATLHDPYSDGAQSVAFSLDGNTLAAADSNGSAYLWNVSSLNP